MKEMLQKIVFCMCLLFAFPYLALAQPGTVLSQKKINDTQGGFMGGLDDDDRFGVSVVSLGDMDGNGVDDLAVGAYADDDGGTNRGAVWVLFLKSDGTVESEQKISDTQGGFTGILDDFDLFGTRLTSLGDLDGDCVNDLAVGVQFDDDGGQDIGAVWILFLNSDGTVKSHQKISATQGGFTGTLNVNDRFGQSVALVGDYNGDGIDDLAVGALDDDGGTDRGAVWLLSLNTNGTVNSHQKISDTAGGFKGLLDDFDAFSTSVAWSEDLDGDGIGDLAVGATGDDDGGTNNGAVWLLFLNAYGTVKSHQKISATQGGFTGVLEGTGTFGNSVLWLDDIDGDAVSDLAVGEHNNNDGGVGRGAVWVLFLKNDSTVKSHQKISDVAGNFTGTLDDFDEFGTSLTSIGDFDGDGLLDIVVGANRDDDGGTDRGAIWMLFMDGIPPPVTLTISNLNPLPPITITPGGGTISYTGAGLNNTTSPMTGDVRTTVVLPNGNQIGPTFVFNNLTLMPGLPLNGNITENVPAFAPSGKYIYKLNFGVFSMNTVTTSAQFCFTKSTVKTSSASIAQNNSNPVNADIDFVVMSDWSKLFTEAVAVAVPTDFVLDQNYPNPLNPSTVIRFQLPTAGDVELAIYSMTGQLVRTLAKDNFANGNHSVVWDGTDDHGARVASGVYVYRIMAGDFMAQKKLVLLK